MEKEKNSLQEKARFQRDLKDVKKKEALIKERRRVYGVYGLTEWEMQIGVGGGSVRINFRDGSLSGHGVVPATFATGSPFLQHLIETSPQYASGRISRLR